MSCASDSCFDTSLDFVCNNGTIDKGLGVNPSQSQAVHEFVAVTMQNAASGQSDTTSAQSLLLALEKYQVAKSHNRQSAVIEQDGNIIKQQRDMIAKLKQEVVELEEKEGRTETDVLRLRAESDRQKPCLASWRMLGAPKASPAKLQQAPREATTCSW